MAQPKILFFDGRSIENTGCEMDRFGVTVCRGRDAAPEARFDDASFFYASGACVLVRIAALREVGLFDESYFLYCEDVDLAWRLRIAGWGIAYIDAALCLHDESRSMGREATGKMRYIWRNRITTVIKDTGAARLAYVLPATLALAFTVATWNSVTQRRPLYLWLFLKAVGANVARLPATLRKRRAVQKLRRASDREISRSMAPGSFELRMAGARLKRRGGARDEPGRSRAPP